MIEIQSTQTQHFIRHQCNQCGAELRQYFGATKRDAATSEPHAHGDCPECAFGDIACTQCGDTLCPQHVRTLAKYADYLDPEMRADLKARYGTQVFCPLCFQNILRTPPSRRPPSAQSYFNVPVVLGLSSVFLIIVLGLRSCPAAF
ncbi:hypothetical protein [Acanthopleuribacter pedis]|uniref:Uncharacterized protein n=1 Tax=Acanthopleuribacter pedis TaxID=442870 RepID=A0A8J7QD60_9BACT|nr:hypothetical protein [Acanthopleuribacter pedis]MBO1318851.1 hypothetical protein [Acanthopleuribacter pedis]